MALLRDCFRFIQRAGFITMATPMRQLHVQCKQSQRIGVNLGHDNWIIGCMRGRCRGEMHPPPLAPSTESSRCAVNLRLHRCIPLTLLSIHPIGFPLFMRALSGVLNWDRAERCADWLLDKHCCWLRPAASSSILKMERRHPQSRARQKDGCLLLVFPCFFPSIHLFCCVSLQLTARWRPADLIDHEQRAPSDMYHMCIREIRMSTSICSTPNTRSTILWIL